MPMPITTSCPKCKARFRLAEETAGKQVRCQKCNAVFVVPAFDGMATSAEPAPAAEKAAPAAASSSLPPLPLPPMPTNSPAPPVEAEQDDDRRREEDDEPPPISRRPDGRRRSRFDRPEKKAGSSMLALILVLLGLGVFACLLCGGGTVWFVAADKPGPVAKRDVVKKDGVKNQQQPFVNNNGKLNRFRNNKVPVPGPGGAIPITLDPEGRFRHDSQLTQVDPINRRENRHKLYTIRMEANRTYQIDMMSDQIDSYLILVDDTNAEIAEDDDKGGGLNAFIEFKAPRTGVYQIQATHCPGPNNGIATTGNFILLVERLP
jgi:predicted Zn finger-like uncharacterized protein